MKHRLKLISVFCLLAILVLPLSFVRADSDNSQTTLPITAVNPKVLDNLNNSAASGDGNSNSSNSGKNVSSILKKLNEIKVKDRENRIANISKIYNGEVTRAQKDIDLMGQIIDRLQAQRQKLTGASATDLSDLDALIAKAQTQKQQAMTNLNNVQADAAAIKNTLTAIKGDTDNSNDTASTNISTLKQEVQKFQADVKTLRQSLQTLRATLVSIVQKIEAIKKTLPQPESGGNQ